MSNYRIMQGDVLDVLPTLPDDHWNACICDPPYGLGETPDMAEVLTHWLAGDDYKANGGGFMGKSWDSFVPGPTVWKEVFRILRPGAILMAFGGTRTADLLSIAIRLAGFEKFDEISWIFGSGFPKSLDISAAIDREAGVERDVVGPNRFAGLNGKSNLNCYGVASRPDETAPATDAARTFAGYGSALKPACEKVLCFRKPRTATYAQTAITHGTSCLNVDGCRIGIDLDNEPDTGSAYYQKRGVPYPTQNSDGSGGKSSFTVQAHDRGLSPSGRWPANIILDQAAADLLDEMSGESKSAGNRNGEIVNSPARSWKNGSTAGIAHIDYQDTGGASRFFQVLPTFIYQAKAARGERDEGLEGMPLVESYRHNSEGRDMTNPNNALGTGARKRAEQGLPSVQPSRNNHPCVKPVTLTEYLARLIVPPKEYRDEARILIPFMGSGSEAVGALLAGWLHVDGIEIDESYVEIARQRLDHWQDELSVEPRQITGQSEDWAKSPLFAELAT